MHLLFSHKNRIYNKYWKINCKIFFYNNDSNDDDSDEEESKTQSNTEKKGESSTVGIDEYNFKDYDNECKRKIAKYWK